MMILAGPVEFTAFDIAILVLVAAAPALLVAATVGIVLARRRDPGHRLWYGIGIGVIGFLVTIVIEIALAGIT
jgi:hypothetical protein